MRSRLSFRTVAIVGASALVLPALAGVSFASATSRVSVAGSMPDWARTAHATGTPAAASTLTVNVVLPLRGGEVAEKLAASVSDPKSKDYGHYRTAAAFNAQFAPTTTAVSAVRSYLTGQGLHITEVAPGNRWVSATGTIKQLDKAFGITLKNYSYHGTTQIAPSSAASVPAAVASYVAGITGLDSVSLRRTADHIIANKLGPVSAGVLGKPGVAKGTNLSAGAKAATAPARTPSVMPGSDYPDPVACSAYWGQNRQVVPKVYGKTSLPTYNCGYTPQQVRTAYGVTAAIKGGDTGKGVTVAIIDAYASPTMRQDAAAWSAYVGIPGFKSGQYTEAGTSKSFNLQDECGGADGWAVEEALDVESVHGMAPGANIDFVGAKNCDAGIDASINWVIQNHAADLVSNSYGNLGETGLGSEITLEHSFFVQAAAEGIGFYFSSGDDGDDTIDGFATPQTDYPSSDTMVTSVGGTSLGVNKDSSRLFETSWGSAVDIIDYPANHKAHLDTPLPGFFYGGGGGGTSTIFKQPSYQKGVVPDWLAQTHGSTRRRVVPDVAAIADPFTGYLIIVTANETVQGFAIGGTSLACPIFAGLQALASQGRPTPIGFANPLLYGLGPAAFNDINNPATPRAVTDEGASAVITFGADSSLTAVKGFDNTTGLGTPKGASFLAAEAW